MIFCTDIYRPQRLNPDDSGHPLTFCVTPPPPGQTFHLFKKISLQIQDRLTLNFIQTFMIIIVNMLALALAFSSMRCCAQVQPQRDTSMAIFVRQDFQFPDLNN